MGQRSAHGVNDGFGDIPGSFDGADNSVLYGLKNAFSRFHRLFLSFCDFLKEKRRELTKSMKVTEDALG